MIRSRMVRARDNSVWRIRRHWAPRPKWRAPRLPWRRKAEASATKRPRHDWFDFPFDLPLPDIDGLPGLVVVVVSIAFIIFMIFIGVPLLIFLVESLLIIPILVVFGIAGRVLFGRPWTLEAARTEPPGEPVTWNVVGWGASERAAAQMAGMIRATGGVPGAPAPEAPRAHRRVRH